MFEKKQILKVRCNGNIVNLLIYDYRLSLKVLQKYFSLATGLKYMSNNEEVCISYVEDTDVMEIVDINCVHDVYMPQGSTRATMKQARKRNLLNMLEDIDEVKASSVLTSSSTDDSSTSEIEAIINTDKSQPLRRSNRVISKAKRLKESMQDENKKVRVVRVNWKHRTSIVSEYKSRSSIKSQIKIELDYNKDYSYEEVKKIIIDAFVTEDVKRLFENCEINLGLNNKTLYSFHDEDGKKCGFWEFIRNFRDSGNRLTLNILTTDNIEKKVDSSEKCLSKVNRKAEVKSSTVQTSPLKELQNLQFERPSETEVTCTSASTSSTNVTLVDFTMTEEKIDMQSCSRTSEAEDENLVTEVTKQSVETQTDASEIVFLKQVAPAPKKRISFDAETNIENLSLNIPIIEKEELVLQGRIGKGAQGVVRLGNWFGTRVTVKIILRSRNEVNVLREIKLSETIRHPSFILMIGLCLSDYDYYMIMEYFEGSNLFDIVITKRSNIVLAMKDKHKVAWDTIAGLNFLHQQKSPIIHRDIKPNNILVNKYMQVKICDLGLSKKTMTETYLETSTDSRFKGTLLFLAPEIFIQRKNPTIACDTWATGCTLIELYGEQSVWNLDLNSDIYFELYSKLSKECVPQLEVIPPALREDIKKCFIYNPNDRIKMCELSFLYQCVEFN